MSEQPGQPEPKQPSSAAAQAASRRNGARSRGPKSVAGKARASQNARSHGLRANPHLILANLPDWLEDTRTQLYAAYGQSADVRELVEGIIVAEFNRHQASVLLQQSLTALVAATSDNHWSVQRNLSKLVSQSTDGHDFQFATGVVRTLGFGDNPDLVKARRFRAYERRFRGARDRGLRQLSKLGVIAPV